MHMQTPDNRDTAGTLPGTPPGEVVSMPRNQLKEQRAYIEAACAALKTDYSGLARKARLSTTTITRPMNQPDWAFEFSARSLKKISEASGLPPFEDWATGSQAGRAAPGTPTLIMAADAQGRTVITLPAESPIAEEAPTLLRLYAALSPDRRKLFVMALKHPELTPGGIGSAAAPPSEDLLYEMAESTVDRMLASRGTSLSKLERVKLIQQIVEDVQAEHDANKTSAGKRTVESRKPGKAARIASR